MPSITSYYGISGPVPFVDVNVAADNRLFLDPHAIRLARGPQPFAHDAVECADTFLREVTDSVISGTPGHMRRGENLLQHFVEPWETRLGMSKIGFNGHGGAEGIGSLIWETLNDNVAALIRVGVFKQLEDLPLFVEGVDRDITSDITTRIVFGPLGKFTEAMLAKYPEFTAGAHKVGRFRRQVWLPASREWGEVDISMPIANGKPLMLVPAAWARANLLMSAGRFYETSVLSYAQLELATRTKDNKLLKTPKDRLKLRDDLGRGRNTNLSVTMRAIQNEDDLLAAFKAFVASKYDAPATGEVA